MSVQWQLATVISVMEDTYGIYTSNSESRILIKGNSGISVAIFLAFFLCLVGIEYTFERAEVTDSSSTGIGSKIGYGIVRLVVTLLFLFGFVVQTIVYFVCKSYHHQNIDKSSLADHLEAYRGEYVPLTAKDKQMEQFQV
ncbi:uncharacterized protein LOC141641634 [Silene latifolia]|uniref:uncharacterized protein LOC141641634 n=1 Tax=Silene latifolia TaxID=37657 RepID=UPI003D76A966